MRTRWLGPAIALLMGCLVGGYGVGRVGLPFLSLPAVITSVLALVLPATLSVAVDRAIARPAWAVGWVVLISLLLGGLLVGGVAFPAVWQGYRNDAGAISVLGAMLLAPFAAAFAVGRWGTQGEPDPGWQARAITCGVLAWAGVGLQAMALPYLFPLARLLFPVLVLHQPLPTSSGGFSYGWLLAIPIVFVLIVLYGLGFGFAAVAGLLGGTLRSRLVRAQT